MLFSQTAEYALRAAVHLAAHAGRPQTNQQIAEAMHIPAGYLSKVLQSLSRTGLVRAQRGVGGGFVLDRSADVLSVLDVIHAVDPPQHLADCPLNDARKPNGNLCLLQRRLDDALTAVEHILGSTTLADVIQSSNSSESAVKLQKPDPSTSNAKGACHG